MENQLFMNRLYSIKPYKILQSPSKINIDEFLSLDNHTHYRNNQQSFLSQISPSVKKCETSQSQIISNITSCFDQLFSRIEKVKEEFESEKCVQISDNTNEQNLALEEIQIIPNQYTKLRKNNSTQQTIASISEKNASCKNQRYLRKFSIKQNEPKLKLIKQIKNSDKLRQQKKVTSLQQFIQKQVEEITIESQEVSSPLSPKKINLINFDMKKIKISDFQLGQTLGSGKFGDVFVCKHKATNSIFALKKIMKSTLLQYNMVDQLIKQLKIHYSLDHPNIVKLYTHFEDQYHIFLLMQYADGGTLMNHLNKGQQFVSRILQQMISAIQYLQANNIAHRDIKPQNIVICSNETMKLCDFGWAAKFDNNMKTTFCGTLDYISPQMKDQGQYTTSVDLWSLGVLTFQLLCGFAPFKIEINNWRMRGGSRNTKWNWDILYPPYLTALSQSFMRSILKKNPQERPSLRTCKQHLFIKKYIEKVDSEDEAISNFLQILQ